MKTIALTHGKVSAVDDDAPGIVFTLAWHVGAGGYAVHKSGKMLVLMHRLVIGAKEGQTVDHIDGDKLNNRRVNLRIVTNTENVRYRHKLNSNNTSGFKGVSFTSAKTGGRIYDLSKPWFAKITVDRKQISLGRYGTKKEAATAYDEAAEFYFGIFATPNLKKNVRVQWVVEHMKRELPQKEWV